MRVLRHQFKYKAKPSKYLNKITVVDGIKFHSIKEANFYRKLKQLQEAGEIALFLMQVPIRLPNLTIYRLDFLVFWNDGRCEPIEVKGFMTSVAEKKIKLSEEILGCKITIV